MNNRAFTQPVTLEADTENGGIEMRVLDKVIELNRDNLEEFLARTSPRIAFTASFNPTAPKS